ncbi:C2 calcium-dependent membrane targeting [Corchorus capsularis]|uniref:C2 calcium-dependent membrane targeting n=1 Tax=Corchorus capsularis TaxID=210143 RepID=A0A1R3HUM5_COCAP|nr:C2 calcium-dependent membrane targeting [Corchorus capsularis]
MSLTGIQGQLLEVTVVGCNKLKDTEWISRQDPYVCLEYGGSKFRTRTCTDGGKTPTFQEKFTFSLIEGLKEINFSVWNSNTLTYDDFIGKGKIQLQKVLSQGYDDSPWALQTKTGRFAGEVRVIMHYANARQHGTAYAPSAPPYAAHPPQVPLYSGPPPAASYPPPVTSYATPSAYPAYPSYPPPPGAYPPPPSAYPPPPPPSAYPPVTYPPASAYYPPPPGPFPGLYPPPPY